MGGCGRGGSLEVLLVPRVRGRVAAGGMVRRRNGGGGGRGVGRASPVRRVRGAPGRQLRLVRLRRAGLAPVGGGRRLDGAAAPAAVGTAERLLLLLLLLLLLSLVLGREGRVQGGRLVRGEGGGRGRRVEARVVVRGRVRKQALGRLRRRSRRRRRGTCRRRGLRRDGGGGGCRGTLKHDYDCGLFPFLALTLSTKV